MQKAQELIGRACASADIPTDGWVFWIPELYKKNGELSYPETWKRRCEEGGEYTAYIRHGRDVRIKDDRRGMIVAVDI